MTHSLHLCLPLALRAVLLGLHRHERHETATGATGAQFGVEQLTRTAHGKTLLAHDFTHVIHGRVIRLIELHGTSLIARRQFR